MTNIELTIKELKKVKRKIKSRRWTSEIILRIEILDYIDFLIKKLKKL